MVHVCTSVQITLLFSIREKRERNLVCGTLEILHKCIPTQWHTYCCRETEKMGKRNSGTRQQGSSKAVLTLCNFHLSLLHWKKCTTNNEIHAFIPPNNKIMHYNLKWIKYTWKYRWNHTLSFYDMPCQVKASYNLYLYKSLVPASWNHFESITFSEQHAEPFRYIFHHESFSPTTFKATNRNKCKPEGRKGISSAEKAQNWR